MKHCIYWDWNSLWVHNIYKISPLVKMTAYCAYWWCSLGLWGCRVLKAQKDAISHTTTIGKSYSNSFQTKHQFYVILFCMANRMGRKFCAPSAKNQQPTFSIINAWLNSNFMNAWTLLIRIREMTPCGHKNSDNLEGWLWDSTGGRHQPFFWFFVQVK